MIYIHTCTHRYINISMSAAAMQHYASSVRIISKSIICWLVSAWFVALSFPG